MEMSISRQLYQLQKTDSEIEAQNKALQQAAGQLGDSPALIRAKTELSAAQEKLAELKHRQQAAEWEIDDINSKLSPAEKKLYGGQIRDPKELSNLQNEVRTLQSRQKKAEDKALVIMEQAETAGQNAAKLGDTLKTVEAAWQEQQKQLEAETERLKARLAELEKQRQLLSADIGAEETDLYQSLKARKGQAVSKVEKGICLGCRISLSMAEMRQVRNNQMVQCSSCGRILYLP